MPTPNHLGPVSIRLPSIEEAEALGLKWTQKNQFHILGIEVIKAHPEVDWPEQWAWKDDCISDNAVHPIAREAIYRSIHRLVSKIMIINKEEKVLIAGMKYAWNGRKVARPMRCCIATPIGPASRACAGAIMVCLVLKGMCR